MMAWIVGAWLAVAWAAPPTASSDEEGAERSESSPIGSSDELPPLPEIPAEPEEPDSVVPDVGELESLPYPEVAYRGAAVLGMEPAFVAGIHEGLELIYLRRYGAVTKHFVHLEKEYPGTSIAQVADTLVWQARMLENFDYRYDKEYWASSKQSKRALEAALDEPGAEAWEHLLMGTILGIEAIHTMRQQHYLSALRLAFSAMDHVGRSREAAPDFIDLQLADGLYNYWRTVVTMNSKLLPSFGDERSTGIAQMKRVEQQGIFVRPMATLGLAFAWMEEGNMREAEAACAKLRRSYPDNIINNLVSGIVAIYRKKYDDALARLDDVHRVDPTNTRAHYWKGLAHQRAGSLTNARAAYLRYLQSEHLEKHQVSWANYRLGQVHNREKDYPKAAEYFSAAIRVDGHKNAKRALDRLKSQRKDGKISW